MSERTGPPEERVRKVGERLLATLGRQKWIDRPSYRLEHTLGLARAACGGAGVRVSNLLSGIWLGHPLHPLLTSLPTGAVATTVALDVAGVLPGRGSGLSEASRFALGVGILGSLGSAVTGLNDWQHTHEQARRVGLVHGALNAAATGLYIASWWDRRRGRHLRGVAGSGLGYGITLVSGYLGGALVYQSAIGVDHSGARLTIQDWTPVLPATALETGGPQRVEVAGIGLVLFRNGEDVVAIGEHCPHLGAPMLDAWIDRGKLVCPWHGSQFEPRSGQIVRGPATAPLPCYPTRLREGTIEVCEGAPDTSGIAEGAGG